MRTAGAGGTETTIITTRRKRMTVALADSAAEGAEAACLSQRRSEKEADFYPVSPAHC